MLPRRHLLRIVISLIAMLVGSCGFHLRGQVAMPFDTLYIDAAKSNSPLVDDLRGALELNKVGVVDSADQAKVILSIVSEIPDKQVLSLGSDGRVNEFRLFYRVSIRAYDKQHEWIPAEEIQLRNDFSYDDSKVLAKEAEESMLLKSMRADMVQQIMHRLARSAPTSK
ncbi:MAG: LPS assembly lipoprotein LptE [Gallionella sp.]